MIQKQMTMIKGKGGEGLLTKLHANTGTAYLK